MIKSIYTYRDGLKDGIPIALGYLFVSMGFGITAVNIGLPVWIASLISATNVTSAGQVAGLEIIKGASTLAVSAVEMFLTQLVINLRYSLMGITLSQNLDDSFTSGRRMLTSFMITDEIFAVGASKEKCIGVKYMLGLSTLPFAGWVGGTAIGALAASWMPEEISYIFGMAVYGMFLAIFVQPSLKEKGVLLCVGLAAALSCIVYYLPCLSFISSGFSIIICSVIASTAAALLMPVDDKEDQ